jgi:hypothetical protein
MLPGVGRAAVGETQPFVEGDRRRDIGRLDADFVKLS